LDLTSPIAVIYDGSMDTHSMIQFVTPRCRIWL